MWPGLRKFDLLMGQATDDLIMAKFCLASRWNKSLVCSLKKLMNFNSRKQCSKFECGVCKWVGNLNNNVSLSPDSR